MNAKSVCSKHAMELFRLVMDGTMSGKLDEGLVDRCRVLGLRMRVRLQNYTVNYRRSSQDL